MSDTFITSGLTITKPSFKPNVKFEVEYEVLEERCTIVHITLLSFGPVRIWPTTFLIQEDGKRKKLVQAYNITMYPEWKEVDAGHTFTLLFEGLDKQCYLFDLYEEIPEPGGFYLQKIQRNQSDVYWLDYLD